ncbi:DUF402 domain-containing protein [candidate division WOR-3 bacterium]|uniref:DUF402 domain-containing protein n=1 Tax=candidate division WOR-3 bacterium TaxID=2052148 RepID=A0A9D5QC08_UNCW3|nr:DUF402 domain-containing protein [candidate division WOR-3 bacterium]MBD3364168.1 DUF402 domain-containing protein [candidate division WOR-3 bacterium]
MRKIKPFKIYYFRPPSNELTFDAELLYEDSEVIVTSHILQGASGPVVIEGKKVVDNGYRAVFAEYRNLWHDVARVFTPDGTFTGYYADINTPSEEREDGYWTKDLFLDLWIPPDRSKITVLDEDEFAEAVRNEWITADEIRGAEVELARLLAQFEKGQFPPDFLERFS